MKILLCHSAGVGLVCIVLLLFSPGLAARAVTCTSPEPTANATFEYFVSIAEHDRHRLHVSIRYHSDSPTEFAMPVWNALYQVRDFAQYITNLQARNGRGETLQIEAIDKSRWKVASAHGCGILEYDDFADVAGPFGAQANDDHVFVNWAQVLPYASQQRDAKISLTVTDVPAVWKLRDLGRFDETSREGAFHLTQPISYDALVDSPVEISNGRLVIFEEDGARYRMVIDADSNDYDLAAVEDALKKIVHAEVEWMQDRPFDEYTFLYHFPHAPVGGGMEHSFGAAISTPASRLKDNPLAPISTTAHEFFHLWNVKRIRPSDMEPVDFQHEQYTRALWFAEGTTSTASELMLVRAGLEDERAYLAHVSDVISDFESHLARHMQSPEASSLEAWLEGHPYYRRGERSVSYYTSGEVLGVLLDLRIRSLTHGTESLRDLFQAMNHQFAKQHRLYDDSRDVQRIAESVSGGSLEDFFAGYVRGTRDIAYEEFFRCVGLKLESVTTQVGDAGFDASINFSGFPEVTEIAPGSVVEAAGVRVGDKLEAIDDREYLGDLSSYLSGRKSGETVSFRFNVRGKVVNVKVVLKTASDKSYNLADLPNVTAEQRAQRAAWIRGDDVAPGAKR